MFIEDLNSLRESNYIDWGKLSDKVVYVSGATGLIGSSVVETLLECSTCKVVVQVRNKEKAERLFQDKVNYVICDLGEHPDYIGSVNYVIHCANPTSSKYFVDHPVETIETAVNGTIHMLKFAKEKAVDAFVFLSTMEVYGTPERGHRVKENEGGNFDSSVVRNCYPLSKMACESLCVAYASEYHVPTRVLRLTQTFGPGVDYNDSRVFAEFTRCVIEKRTIVLKTKGQTERSYLYIADAISAILAVLLNGEEGEIYNAANDDTFCSIYKMACLVADMGGIDVAVKEQDTSKLGYAGTIYMDLDTTKLRKLGWSPKTNLRNSFSNLILDMERYKK